MKNEKFDVNLIASLSVILTAIFTLGVACMSLIFYYTFTGCGMYDSDYEGVSCKNYGNLIHENMPMLETGYVMLKTFRTAPSEIYQDTRIHQSVILSKDIEYQFQINFLKTKGNHIVFEMHAPQESQLVKTVYLDTKCTKINVRVPMTGLYVLKLYDKNSEHLSGVLTIVGKSR